jgi:3-dehydroquinate synthase
MDKIISQRFLLKFNYDVIFTKDVFNTENYSLINLIKNKNIENKFIIFIDKNVYKLHINLVNNIKNYFFKHNKIIKLQSDPFIIYGGEVIKNHYILVKYIYKLIDAYKICRQSYIISIGGGALQDLVGFAASTAHRGVRLIRIPTTTLSQDDSGVGVKNGINFINKKNFIGCFSIPFAVINDYKFISTLSDSRFIEGLSEAIKVSLIKNINLFNKIEKNFKNIIKRKDTVIKYIIYKSAYIHAKHISSGGDPFEITSSRPLDFGHWAAHKLENLSKYKISHGNAVAIGIALDSTYSFLIGILSKYEWKRVIKLLININLPIYSKELNYKKNKHYLLFDGLNEFREHLGGQLTITLLKKIGEKIDVHEINKDIYIKSIKILKLTNFLKNVNK